MAVNAFTSNQGTQSALLTDNTGGTAGTLIPVMKLSMDGQGTFTTGNLFQGTITQVNNIGTLPNLPQGSINVTAGTIGTVTGAGTITNVGSVTNIGMVNAATISSLPNLPQGSINVTAGTIGTVTGVGVVSVLTKGTISLGSVGGIDANAVAQTGLPIGIGGTDSGGTIRTILVDSTGVQRSSGSMVMTVGTVTVLPNLPQGSINVTAGTVNTGTINTGTFVMTVGTITTGSLSNVAMLNAGTISTLPNLPQGSINVTAGTITTGTLSPIPTIANVTYGTHGTTGVSIFGTLAGGTGSGAGTEIFCTSVSLSIPSTGGSQDVSIGWGTNGGTFQAGTGLLVRGNFPPGGGIQKTFWPPTNSGTNGQLCVFQAGAGTVDVSVTYFITPSTL